MLFRPDCRERVHIHERRIHHGGARAFSLSAQNALFLYDLYRTGRPVVIKGLALIIELDLLSIELELLRLLRQPVISDRNGKLIGLESNRGLLFTIFNADVHRRVIASFPTVFDLGGVGFPSDVSHNRGIQ